MPSRKLLSELMGTLRARLVLESYQAIYLTVGSGVILAPISAALGDLYERYHDADGFLYVAYTLENTFGSV